MPRFWGFHQGVIPYNEIRHWKGRTFTFPTPIDPRMRAGDHIYLFWQNDELYGRGIIEEVGKPDEKLLRPVVVTIIDAQSPGVKLNETVRTSPLFENYNRLQQEGCLSSFNDDQLRYLNGLLQRLGIKPPPDPDAVREEKAAEAPLRPVVGKFIRGERLRIDETRFDEFKTVVGPNPVNSVLSELDSYVLGFLTIEDRRYEEYCRIFWGIDNANNIVGFTVNTGQRDQLRRKIEDSIRGIEPRLAPSSHYIEFHPMLDEHGNVINDFFVLEVAVGHGERQVIYCSSNGSFYIKQDGINRQLKGQLLVEEIRRRMRTELMKELKK